MTLIKICGITSVDDGLLAIEQGADVLGIIGVAASARYCPPAVAAALVRAAGPFVPVVSVVRHAAETHGVGELWTQFYEGPPPATRTGIRVFRIRDRESLEELRAYGDPVIALHLDAYHESALGGVGQRFDWELAVEAKALRPDLPLILAGGLTPDNVGEAVRRVRPYAVDVSSGVEAALGKKDPVKLRDFVAAVHGA